MAFSEIELKRIEKEVGGFCEKRSPIEIRDKLSFEYRIKTHDVIIYMRRGSSCTCGNHYGGCEAMHNGRKISMDFEYNANAANPISHPLNVFEGKKKVKDWEELLCPPGLEPARVSLSGKQVVVEGRFINKNTFMAHKIQIMP